MESKALDHKQLTDSAREGYGFLGNVVFYGLMATLVVIAIPYGTVQPWWIAIFDCLVFILAIVALVDSMTRRDFRIDMRPMVPLLALVLFAVIQTLPLLKAPGPVRGPATISADPAATRFFAVELIALVLVVVLLSHYVRTERRLRRLIYVVLAIGIASALFGFARRHWQQNPGFLLPALPTGDRSFAQFINRNHFAVLMEMTLGLALGVMLASLTQRRRLFLLLPVAVLFWVAIIFSNSRGGIISSFCELLFIGVIIDPVRYLIPDEGDSKWTRIRSLAGGFIVRGFLVLALIGLLIYGVGWIGGEPVVSNFELAAADFTHQEADQNLNSSRRQIWAATWQMIKANPITGQGFGGYWTGITRYHAASGEITPQQAHNDYLELLASGGLIAAALVVWFLVLFVARARLTLRTASPYCRGACIGALAGVFGVAIHSFVDFGLHITINALILFVLIFIAVQSDRLARATLN